MPFDFTREIPEDAKLLMRAREIVAERWCQGHLLEGHRRCAIGAIYEVAGCLKGERHAAWVHVTPGSAITRLELKLTLVMSRPDSVAAFNDRSTHEEVLELFDKAIEKELINAV